MLNWVNGSAFVFKSQVLQQCLLVQTILLRIQSTHISFSGPAAKESA